MPTGKRVFSNKYQLMEAYYSVLSGEKTKEEIAKKYGCALSSIDKNFNKLEKEMPNISDIMKYGTKNIKDIFFDDKTEKGRFKYDLANKIPFQFVNDDNLMDFFIEAFQYFTNIESDNRYSNIYMILFDLEKKVHVNIVEDRLIYYYSNRSSSSIESIKYIRINMDWETTEISIYKKKKKGYGEKKLSSNVEESFKLIKKYLSKFDDIIFPNFIHMACLNSSLIKFNIYNGEKEEE